MTTIERLRSVLEGMGCKFIPGHKVHYFEVPMFEDTEKQLHAYLVDSLYCALNAEERVIAFRAYVQAKEYFAKLPSSYKHRYETAHHEARDRIEAWLR